MTRAFIAIFLVMFRSLSIVAFIGWVMLVGFYFLILSKTPHIESVDHAVIFGLFISIPIGIGGLAVGYYLRLLFNSPIVRFVPNYMSLHLVGSLGPFFLLWAYSFWLYAELFGHRLLLHIIFVGALFLGINVGFMRNSMYRSYMLPAIIFGYWLVVKAKELIGLEVQLPEVAWVGFWMLVAVSLVTLFILQLSRQRVRYLPMQTLDSGFEQQTRRDNPMISIPERLQVKGPNVADEVRYGRMHLSNWSAYPRMMASCIVFLLLVNWYFEEEPIGGFFIIVFTPMLVGFLVSVGGLRVGEELGRLWYMSPFDSKEALLKHVLGVTTRQIIRITFALLVVTSLLLTWIRPDLIAASTLQFLLMPASGQLLSVIKACWPAPGSIKENVGREVLIDYIPLTLHLVLAYWSLKEDWIAAGLIVGLSYVALLIVILLARRRIVPTAWVG